jgi:NAD(P)-dependent dehydrogenase (short-subunit alcohol dehydrogenase family)
MTDVLESELKAHGAELGQPIRVQDVSDEDGWRETLAWVEGRFGRLDILVNNAGYGWLKDITDIALEDWRRLMAVNVDGVFLGMKHCIPLMARDGGGVIVNMSSMYGTVGNAGTSAYCASKGAVTMMTKAVALECAAAKNGIRVNSIHPGYVATPSVAETLDDEQIAALRVLHPMDRLADPAEIARATLFLASDDASFMTGSELHVDGGFTAR